jgi:membrane protein
MIKPGAALAAARERSGFLDHLIRTYQRYQADTGDRLAAAVTFYWFLSLFPILLLVLAGYGYLHSGDSAEQLNERLGGTLGGFLPTQLVDTLTETLSGAKGKAGLIGLGGLLLSGLGWIDALREAIRTIWHQNVKAGNFITRKLVDIVALVGLFATIGASAFVTGLAGSGPEWLLQQLGVDETTGAKVFLKVLGIALAALVDVVLFLYLFLRLARVRTPVRRVLKGAVFGAVGFGILKLVGGFYVQHTTESGKATYGTFAVVVGLLLFLNLVSRLVLLASAFVVTGPGDDDVRPSGTADREQARKAGIPPEYADQELTITDDGAPTPLRPALQDEPERSWSPRREPTPALAAHEPQPAAAPVELKGAAQVRRAAQVTAAAGGLLVAVVALYGAKTVRGLLRR